MTDMLTALSRALPPLWEMSLTAAYAAVIVAVLRQVLKKRAPRQVLCLLWLVVFARLLIPVSFESPLSIVPDAQQVQRFTGQTSVPSGEGGGQTVSIQPAVQSPAQGQTDVVSTPPVSQGSAGTGPVLTAPSGTVPFAPQPELPGPFPWQALLAGIWLAGVLVMIGYGLISCLRLKRRLYDAIRAPDGAWEHPSVSSPFILGLFQPRIYLPAGLQGQPRQFILCHERAHLRRGDHIVKPVCWLALALHWFDPFVWMAFILMSRDIEAACDEAVIRQLGPRVKADYSETLLSLATNGRIPAPCPLAFDEGDAKGRIKDVLRYRRPALWIVVISAVMAVLAAVCLLTDPVSAQAPEGDPDPSASVSQDPGPSQSPEGDPIADPWMLEVLDGEREFFVRGAGSLTIDRLAEVFFGDEPGRTVAVSKLAAIDLDGDGVKEMVLWPSINGDDSIEAVSVPGYLILRWGEGEIFGFDPGFRSFAYLKEDGTFYWSGSAFEGGIAAARFPDDIYFHLENISWCEFDGLETHCFVDGQGATREGYEAAIYAQDHKPDVPWWVYEGGQLWPAPLEAPFRPDSLLSDPGPRDLTQEELDYFQEYFATGDGKVPNIRSMLLVSEYSAPRDIDLFRTFYHGFHYVADISRAERDALGWNGYFEEIKVTAAEMDQTLRAYLGLGLEETNKVGLDYFHYLPDYDAYYTAHTDFGGDMFTMRSGRIRSDGTIALVYDSSEYRTTRVALLEEAEQIYAHRLYYRVKANLPADYQDPYAAIPQPAPSPEPAPSAAPEPSQSLSAAQVACEHGLDNAVFEFTDGILVIYCEEDGARYPVPAVTSANYEGHMRGDFDGDGRMELAFTRTDPDFARDDGTLLVADVVDGQLQTYLFDPAYLASGFNDTVTYEFVDEYQAMDFTYQGHGMRVDLSEQWSAMMTHGRSYYPYAYDRETFYTPTQAWAGADFDMSIPVWLEGGFGGHICYLTWGLRYTGSGFRLIDGSFGYRMPQ